MKRPQWGLIGQCPAVASWFPGEADQGAYSTFLVFAQFWRQARVQGLEGEREARLKSDQDEADSNKEATVNT